MKTVIEMAREVWSAGDVYIGPSEKTLERFAELVRADEREALVESIDWTALMRQGGLVTWGDAEELGDRVVAAVRARGDNT
jgi:hypothetical protein